MAKHANPRRRQLRIGALCAALALGGLGAVSLGSPSQAESTSTDWSVPLSAGARLGTLPDGSVAALTAGQGITHLTKSGVTDWTKADTLVDQGPITDSSGNIYWTSNNCSTATCLSTLMSSTESGTSRPDTRLPVIISSPLKDGPDGLIYAAGASRLFGVSKADGYVALNVATDPLGGDVDALFPYPGGVATVSATAATFYPLTGSNPTSYPLSPDMIAKGAATASGVVYVTQRDCDQGGATTLTSFTAAGQQWRKPIGSLPCGATSDSYLATLPDGGVVVRSAVDTDFGLVTAFNADGSQRWQSPVSSPLDSQRVEYTKLGPVVDANGAVGIPDSFTFRCQTGSDTCWGVQVVFFSAVANGTVPASLLLKVGDPKPESFGNPLTSVALAPGQVYLSAGHSDGSQYSSTLSEEILTSEGANGLGASWPQSINWNVQQTPLPDRYVALGDSYSSGEGAPDRSAGQPPYLDGTNVTVDYCHRSVNSWAVRAASQMKMSNTFDFRACSGGIIQDMYAPSASFPGAEQSQLASVNARSKYITLMIGGNNSHFADVIGWCALAGPTDSCRKQWSAVVDASISHLSSDGGPGTHDNLPQLYGTLRALAPKAKIYVVGYPRFFPLNPPKTCSTGVPLRSFKANDMKWINSEILTLDNLIKAQAKLSDLAFIDTYNAFTGHELCASTPYMNRAIPSPDSSVRQQSFHPNTLGQKAIAKLVSARVR